MRLFIPAHSFRNTKSQLVQNEVTIGIVEVLYPADQLLLEVNGAFPLGTARVEAWQGEEQLRTVKGANFPYSSRLRLSLLILRYDPATLSAMEKLRGTMGAFSLTGTLSHFTVSPPGFSEELRDVLPFGNFRRHSLVLVNSTALTSFFLSSSA